MNQCEDNLQKLLERERQLRAICSELNNYVDLKPTLLSILQHIKGLTGGEALGIRLHDGGDYPYSGFPESFITKENSLCAKDDEDNRLPFPIKVQSERIGLIQVNDMRTGMFTYELIQYLEMIGDQIGLAVKNSMLYTNLKNAYDEINILRGIIPICSYCKKIRDDEGYWHQVEAYIGQHSTATSSHGICPQCFMIHAGR